jgi:putative Holliday junction resolvase
MPCGLDFLYHLLNNISTFATSMEKMSRILAIDYGQKRVGVAVTDPMKIIASPLTTVVAKEFEAFLIGYVEKEGVDEFVIGYPVMLNNLPSESVKYVEPFIKKLKKMFPNKPVHLVDERFTSKMALRAMIDGGMKKKDRRDKAMVDKISAAIILQSFLNNRSFLQENEKQI